MSVEKPTALGVRSWLASDGRLTGYGGYVWQPGLNTAECNKPTPHKSFESCTCGLYSFVNWDQLDLSWRSSQILPERVYGIVEVGGDVVRAERGTRAQHAVISALVAYPETFVIFGAKIPTRPLLYDLADAYEVDLLDPEDVGLFMNTHGAELLEPIKVEGGHSNSFPSFPLSTVITGNVATTPTAPPTPTKRVTAPVVINGKNIMIKDTVIDVELVPGQHAVEVTSSAQSCSIVGCVIKTKIKEPPKKSLKKKG